MSQICAAACCEFDSRSTSTNARSSRSYAWPGNQKMAELSSMDGERRKEDVAVCAMKTDSHECTGLDVLSIHQKLNKTLFESSPCRLCAGTCRTIINASAVFFKCSGMKCVITRCAKFIVPREFEFSELRLEKCRRSKLAPAYFARCCTGRKWGEWRMENDLKNASSNFNINRKRSGYFDLGLLSIARVLI